LGLLQLSADDFEYTTDNPLVWVDLELKRVRMLPFDHVQVFLLRLTRSLIAPRPDYPPAQEMIHNAMLKLLWPYKSQYEEDADLELGYGGSAAHFLASRIISGMPESGTAK
jgi:hypothetical protein